MYNVELKPCHVCGATRGLYVLEDYDGCEWYVFCDNCKTSVHSEYALTKEEAIKAWNTRHEHTCNLIPAPYREFTIGYEYKCSVCGCYMTDHDSYCSECGARRMSRC